MPIRKRVVKNIEKIVSRRTLSNDAKPVKMVPFGRAIANFFNKYFQFGGVATRAEYWWVILFVVGVAFVLINAAVMLQPVNLLLAGFIAMLWVLFGVIVLIPLWTLMSRRLHDAGFSAKLLVVSFVFFMYSVLSPEVIRNIRTVNWLSFMWGIIMFILFLFPSKTKDNPYRN